MEPNTIYSILMVAGVLAGGGVVWGMTKSAIASIKDGMKDYNSSMKEQKAKLDLIKEQLALQLGMINVIISRLDRIESDIREIREQSNARTPQDRTQP